MATTGTCPISPNANALRCPWTVLVPKPGMRSYGTSTTSLRLLARVLRPEPQTMPTRGLSSVDGKMEARTSSACAKDGACGGIDGGTDIDIVGSDLDQVRRAPRLLPILAGTRAAEIQRWAPISGRREIDGSNARMELATSGTVSAAQAKLGCLSRRRGDCNPLACRDPLLFLPLSPRLFTHFPDPDFFL